jgi:hypothetical protein
VKQWSERPQVEATLLNPALLASLLSVGAHAYEAKSDQPMIWPLAFLVPPLVLHGPTREVLPKTVATHLPTWIRRQPLIRAGFPYRAARLTPLTREGFRFGVNHGVLLLDEGRLRGTLSPPSDDDDLTEILKSASLVGRWFAKLDQPSSAFALLGVRP